MVTAILVLVIIGVLLLFLILLAVAITEKEHVNDELRIIAKLAQLQKDLDILLKPHKMPAHAVIKEKEKEDKEEEMMKSAYDIANQILKGEIDIENELRK